MKFCFQKNIWLSESWTPKLEFFCLVYLKLKKENLSQGKAIDWELWTGQFSHSSCMHAYGSEAMYKRYFCDYLGYLIFWQIWFFLFLEIKLYILFYFLCFWTLVILKKIASYLKNIFSQEIHSQYFYYNFHLFRLFVKLCSSNYFFFCVSPGRAHVLDVLKLIYSKFVRKFPFTVLLFNTFLCPPPHPLIIKLQKIIF